MKFLNLYIKLRRFAGLALSKDKRNMERVIVYDFFVPFMAFDKPRQLRTLYSILIYKSKNFMI